MLGGWGRKNITSMKLAGSYRSAWDAIEWNFISKQIKRVVMVLVGNILNLYSALGGIAVLP